MRTGFMYLVAVMDWYSCYVLSWQLSNTLESTFCIEALQQALPQGRPGIFNTDQGAQFTATAFTEMLKAAQIQISMDGKGRAFDNIFNERLWRTVKHEDVYLKQYETVPILFRGLDILTNRSAWWLTIVPTKRRVLANCEIGPPPVHPPRSQHPGKAAPADRASSAGSTRCDADGATGRAVYPRASGNSSTHDNQWVSRSLSYCLTVLLSH